MQGFVNELVELYEMLNRGLTAEDILQDLYERFDKYIPYDRICIVLRDTQGNLHAQAIYTKDKPKIKKGFILSEGNTTIGTVISSRQYRIISDYVQYLNEHPESITTQLMLEEGIYSSISFPIITNDVCFGVLIFSSKKADVYQEEYVEYGQKISNAVAILVEKNFLVDDLILTAITGFARLVEAKDSDTGLHLERMQNYSKILSIKMRDYPEYKDIIDESFVEDVYRFSPLHDIGKVGIADGILLKPAKLTPEEFEVMKMHTLIGSEVLKKASNNLLRNGRHFFDIGIEIALSHHEKYDGNGYPFGLKGDEIPLPARIVMVADVLDALTSKRVYKNAIVMDDAIDYIVDESGKSFDPDVVQALLDSKDKIMEVYQKYQENMDMDRR